VSGRIALAVDGGNSKTDLALVREDGALLAHVRSGGSSPHHLGVDGCLEVLEGLLDAAIDEAGLPARRDGVAETAQLLLAGIDFPAEERTLLERVTKRGWARRIIVGNDTFAILRAGTDRGWGVAITCGAGINCVGVGADGRHARFLALGPTTGDWGGGYDVGMAAVAAAARSEDGRGPKTVLETTVPAHFGLATPSELAEAFHVGQLPVRRVAELAPALFGLALEDTVAAEIVERLAMEMVAFARAALHRLELTSKPVEVLLGGGMVRSGDGRLVDAVAERLRDAAPNATVRSESSPPIVGAALLALDDLGADRAAQDRSRRELGEAVAKVRAPRTRELA
jgi:N-acetylglucosamine kinase-like BadF-type ATPase